MPDSSRERETPITDARRWGRFYTAPDWVDLVLRLALRRQGLQLTGDKRRNMLNQAEGILRQALGQSSRTNKRFGLLCLT